MKHLFQVLVALLLSLPAMSQNELRPIAREIANRQLSKAIFTQQNDLFKIDTKGARIESIAAVVSDANVLELQPASLKTMLSQRATNLQLSLPTNQGNMDLQLYQVNPFDEGFSVQTSDGKFYTQSLGVHYRGIVKGDNSSLVAISIYDDEVMGVISTQQETSVLGRMGAKGNQYILYADKNLKKSFTFNCQADKKYQVKPESPVAQDPNARIEATKCVRAYWEADYSLYTTKGSNTTNVVNYLTGLFNQSKILYDNDGISITLSQIYVWTSNDPYGNGDAGSHLDAFRTYRTSFNGDLAHLLSSEGGGGIAYVDVLCNSGYRYGYSGIDPTYNNVPTFSWSVMVVTHEQGHILGSPHTQSCSWNGNNTAIDNCVATEGGCASVEGPRPAGGGTIMSYCHLVQGVGINLSKGFGPQPKQRIINSINAKSCLAASCGGTSAPLTNNAVYKIVAQHSNKIADISGGNTADGAPAIQWDYLNGSNQQWRALDLGGGYWRFVNIKSGKTMEVGGQFTGNGGLVQQWTWVNAPNQQWSLQTAGNGFYYVVNRRSGLVLDVAGNSTTNGAQVTQWQNVGGGNQKWRFDLITNPQPGAGAPQSAATEVTTALQVIPNPASSDFKVLYYSSQRETVAVNLYDARGSKALSQPQAVVEGLNEIVVSAAALKAGLHVVMVGKQSTKVLILK